MHTASKRKAQPASCMLQIAHWPKACMHPDQGNHSTEQWVTAGNVPCTKWLPAERLSKGLLLCGCCSPDGGDLLHHISRGVQVDEALVDPAQE
jgi:hypothetical protein